MSLYIRPNGNVVVGVCSCTTMAGEWLTVYVRTGTTTEENRRLTVVTQILSAVGYDEIDEGQFAGVHLSVHRNEMRYWGHKEYTYLARHETDPHKHYLLPDATLLSDEESKVIHFKRAVISLQPLVI